MKRVRRVALLLATVALFATWAIALRPATLGGPITYIVVRGDSMLPTHETGDLLLLSPELGYGVGDDVGYRVPAGELGGGRVVVHRIVGGDAGGYILRGDNNPAPDPWTPSASDVVGKVWLAVPGVGRIVAWVRQPAVIASLAAAMVAWSVVMGGASPRTGRRVPAASRVPGRRSVSTG